MAMRMRMAHKRAIHVEKRDTAKGPMSDAYGVGHDLRAPFQAIIAQNRISASHYWLSGSRMAAQRIG
jgi:hypothetical protein